MSDKSETSTKSHTRTVRSIGVIALMGLIILLFSCSKETTGIEHLNKAISYMDEGDLNSAIIEAKNAVNKIPENARSRKILAQLHLQTGNPESAERQFNIARELTPSDYSLIAPLARSLIKQNKGDQVLSIDLSGLSDDDMADTLVSIAYAQLAVDDFDAAIKNIEKARNLDPDSTYAILAKARIKLFKQQKRDAFLLVQKAISLEPNNYEAWEMNGDIYWEDGDFINAESAYEVANQKQRNNFAGMLKNAQTKIQLGKFSEAQSIVHKLSNGSHENSSTEYLQGLLHYHQGDLKAAQTSFEKVLSIDSNHDGAAYQLSLTHLRLGNLGQAGEYARTHLLLNPSSTSGKKLYGRIQIENKQYQQAEELIKPLVLTGDGDIIAARLLASALFKQGKMDEAVNFLTKASADTLNLNDQFFQSNPDLLIEEFESGYVSELGEYTSQQVKINEILRLVNSNQLNQALSEAQSFVEKNPDKTTPWNLLGNILYSLKNYEEARAAFEESSTLSPGEPTAGHFLAEIALLENDVPTARFEYERVLANHPDHLQTLLGLAYLDALSDDRSAMIARLKQAQQSMPTALTPKILMARYSISTGSEADAISLIQSLPLSQRNSPAALITLVLAQLQVPDFNDARNTLDRLSLVQEKNSTWYYLSSKVHEGLEQYDAATTELDKAIELGPSYSPARNRIIEFNSLLNGDITDKTLVFREPAEKLETVKKAETNIGEDNSLPDSEISNTALTNDNVNNIETNTSYMQAQFMEAKKQWHVGDKSEAITILTNLKSEWLDNLEIRHTLAIGYAELNELDKATTEFNEILALDPKDYIALNNLAWYTRIQSPGKALEYARRALEIAPDAIEIIDTIAAIQLETGDLEAAASNLNSQILSNSNEPAIMFNRAKMLVETGDKAEAIRLLNSLINRDTEFPEKHEASDYLNELTRK